MAESHALGLWVAGAAAVVTGSVVLVVAVRVASTQAEPVGSGAFRRVDGAGGEAAMEVRPADREAEIPPSWAFLPVGAA
jgi:hypothetical protein